MAQYFVGDIQGCYTELRALLAKVNFGQDDELWVAGDMVARGPDSLATLRFLKSLGNQVKAVLGNHDLHLLATAAGIKKVKKQDLLADLLNAPDKDVLLAWLSKQPLIRKLPNEEVYMSHAGISPQWSVSDAMVQGQIAHELLSSEQQHDWLAKMYGNTPLNWHEAVTIEEKFRYTINVLTRMRFCEQQGELNLTCKTHPDDAPAHLQPWFELSPALESTTWVFGHWASLMGKCASENAYAIDTGCVWGNYLTLLRWHDKQIFIELSAKKVQNCNL